MFNIQDKDQNQDQNVQQKIFPKTIKSVTQNPSWAQAETQKLHFIICGDSSSSMSIDDKYIEANKAIEELICELAKPENNNAFLCSVIFFNHAPDVVAPFMPADTLSSQIPKLDPVGGTDIAAALEEANKLLQSQDLSEDSQKPILILFSDGQSSNVAHAANALKTKCDIVTIAFGDDADEETLKEIASTHGHFFKCISGQDIVKLFCKMGKSMTQSISSHQSVIDNLQNI